MGNTRTPEPGHGRQLLALAICCLSVLPVSLNTTILNVALPAIRQDLNSSVTELQWTLGAYTNVLAALRTSAGSAADRLGCKRAFRLGLIPFTVGATLCSLAPTTGWLADFRTAQATGGPCSPPGAVAILTHAFPHPPRADTIDRPLERGRRPEHGCWADLMAAAGAPAWPVPYASRRDEPLIGPKLFRSAPFSGPTATAVLTVAALSGFLFANSVHLQGDLGPCPLDAGLRLLPMAALSPLCTPLSGRSVGSRGPRVPLLIAGAGIASSGVLTAPVTRSPHPSPLLLSLVYALFGLGFGFVNAPVTNTAVAGLPSGQAGVAASIAGPAGRSARRSASR
ncbi:MFS transporter [Streptomyces sp. NPDC051704]|uniref:MFS transporter n=1 Tax=Streptomyces sp. NPDC051704 TaxID=3365671 RepID=UPI003788F70E